MGRAGSCGCDCRRSCAALAVVAMACSRSVVWLERGVNARAATAAKEPSRAAPRPPPGLGDSRTGPRLQAEGGARKRKRRAHRQRETERLTARGTHAHLLAHVARVRLDLTRHVVRQANTSEVKPEHSERDETSKQAGRAVEVETKARETRSRSACRSTTRRVCESRPHQLLQCSHWIMGCSPVSYPRQTQSVWVRQSEGSQHRQRQVQGPGTAPARTQCQVLLPSVGTKLRRPSQRAAGDLLIDLVLCDARLALDRLLAARVLRPPVLLHRCSTRRVRRRRARARARCRGSCGRGGSSPSDGARALAREGGDEQARLGCVECPSCGLALAPSDHGVAAVSG